MSLFVEIEKQLGNFHLDVRFQAETETLALLGASGCGKSVTLKCIAGILTPDEGHIELDGVTLYDSASRINLPPQRRQVGYLFQQYALFPNMTVRQNIAAAVRDKARRQTEVAEKLRQFRLEAVAYQKPGQLSGGMLQRVGIAVAMLNDPKLLILDEPTAGLDPRERVRFRNLIHTLAEDRIVILSTHIVSDIETIAGQIVMFKDHRLYCCDSPARICARFQGRVFQLPAGMPLAPGQFLLSEGQAVSYTHLTLPTT